MYFREHYYGDRCCQKCLYIDTSDDLQSVFNLNPDETAIRGEKVIFRNLVPVEDLPINRSVVRLAILALQNREEQPAFLIDEPFALHPI